MSNRFESNVRRAIAYALPFAACVGMPEQVSSQSSGSTQIREALPAVPGGRVSVENLFGAITVTEWDRNQVLVEGTRGDNVREIAIETSPDGIEIAVILISRTVTDDTRLELNIPKASQLGIETLEAQVNLRGVTGSVSVTSLGGGVSVQGNTTAVAVETVAGSITVDGSQSVVEAESVGGAVRIRRCSGEVTAETASGRIEINGGTLRRVYGGSVSGTIVFRSAPHQHGELEFENGSGSVTLALPSDLTPELLLETQSGQVQNDFGTTASGGPKISVKTDSGSIAVRRAQGPGSGPKGPPKEPLIEEQ